MVKVVNFGTVMNSSWVSHVDMLADAGIVNFDAAAYVTGAPARYVGNPHYPITSAPPLNIAPLPKDEYQSTTRTDKPLVTNPPWKTIAFSILAVGGLLFGVHKLGKLPSAIKNLGTKTADFFKNLFKKKP